MIHQTRFEFLETATANTITLRAGKELLQNAKFISLIHELQKIGVEVSSLEGSSAGTDSEIVCSDCNNPLQIARNEYGIYNLVCCEPKVQNRGKDAEYVSAK